MEKSDFIQLTDYAKSFTGLTQDKEALLLAAGDAIKPGLADVTDRFYDTLQSIERTAPFIEGKLASLKATHKGWLEGLFSGPFDVAYTESMYRVGSIHVKVGLPVEFMSGGMSLIAEELFSLVDNIFKNDPDRARELVKAINAVMGFSLLIMQQSYQSASLASELERFLAITGMSRALFNNLAGAYDN